jgi:hypothetical protein
VSAAAGTCDPGKRPELAWLPVAQLAVDHRYQRTLESRRSQNLIERIAKDFRWAAFQAVLATAKEGGAGWLVLDGQHRVEAARRCRIAEVPAVVVEAASLAEQAAAFARANTDRVAVNPYALFHARLVAGDAATAAVARRCKAAGIVIPHYPIPADKLKPGETMALAAIARLPLNYGDAIATAALDCLGRAYRGVAGGVCAPAIAGTAMLLRDAGPERREAVARAIEAYLRGRSPAELRVAALRYRSAHGGREMDAYRALIKRAIGLELAPRRQAGGFIAAPDRARLMAGR